MSTARLYELGLTTEDASSSAVRLYELSLSAAPGAVRLYELTLTAQQSVEPLSVVTLPDGTWTQTAGNTVTVTDGAFTAPATISGTTIGFTSDGHTVTYRVLPHTLWRNDGTKLVGLKI